MLGRWAPEGSDQYVRSYNAVIARLQNKFAQPIRVGDGYNAFDEGAVLEGLKVWLTEKWGVKEDISHDAVEGWKAKIKPYSPFQDLVEEGTGGDGCAKTPKVVEESSSSSSDSSSSGEEEPSTGKKRLVTRLETDRPTGFVVVYNRIDRGKLHRSGDSGCWMAKARRFRRATFYGEMPGEADYTTRCKLCWPSARDDESSSDSEDEMEVRECGSPPKGGAPGNSMYSLSEDGGLWDE